MGRNHTYQRQRAHVARENPKFLQTGDNGGAPNRAAVIEEFNRLTADNAYGRNPEPNADRPVGGVIPISPPLKAADLNQPGLQAGADIKYPAHEAKLEKIAAKKQQASATLYIMRYGRHLTWDQLQERLILNFGLGTDLADYVKKPKPDADGEVNVPVIGDNENWSIVEYRPTGRRSSDKEPKAGDRGCFTCGEEGHRKADCPNSPKNGGRACHNCKEEGHIARDCPNPAVRSGSYASSDNRVCFNCNETGHISRDCPFTAPAHGSGACFNCGERGHKAFECQKGDIGRPSRFGGGVGACYTCGERGHFARECPGAGTGGTFGASESYQEAFPTFDDAGFDGDGAGFDDDGYNW